MLHEGYFKDSDDAKSKRMQLELVNYYFSAGALALIWKGGGMWKMGTSLDFLKLPKCCYCLNFSFQLLLLVHKNIEIVYWPYNLWLYKLTDCLKNPAFLLFDSIGYSE